RMTSPTPAVGVPRGIWPRLKLSLVAAPQSVPVVISWRRPSESDAVEENCTILRPKRERSNDARGYVLNVVAIGAVNMPDTLLADADFFYSTATPG
ncbi:MAG TPA: hypothetical protein GX405_09495, partial [Rhizobiales bacterium]|nr:hypothetical protein [Hyphomicrobiales bacterium]